MFSIVTQYCQIKDTIVLEENLDNRKEKSRIKLIELMTSIIEFSHFSPLKTRDFRQEQLYLEFAYIDSKQQLERFKKKSRNAIKIGRLDSIW